jgi:hypothetical protein
VLTLELRTTCTLELSGTAVPTQKNIVICTSLQLIFLLEGGSTLGRDSSDALRRPTAADYSLPHLGIADDHEIVW